MEKSIERNLTDESLLRDIEAYSSYVDNYYEDEDIRDYEILSPNGKGVPGINYTGVANFVSNSGYVRLKADKTSSAYILYKFNGESGFYERSSIDNLIEWLVISIKDNFSEVTSLPHTFKTHISLEVIPFIPTVDDIPTDSMFEANKKYYTEGEVVPFKNGYYSIRYNRFMPRTSCMFTLNPLQVDFNPGAINNTIGVKYREMMDSEAIFEYLFEQMGYTLYANTFTKPTYTVLYGGGANGKSIVVDTLTRILGADAISSVTLEDMTVPFNVASCEGKKANIVFDAGSGYRGDTAYSSITAVPSFMKTASAGELWLFNPKHKDPHIGIPPTKFVFASNNYLNLGDSTDGTNRRLNAVPFNKTFAQDSDLSNRFKGKEETEWFAIQALISFGNFMHNKLNGKEFDEGQALDGEYINCDAGKIAKIEMMVGNNVIDDYLYNCLELDITNKEAVREALIGKEDLYLEFKTYCYEIGRPPTSQTKFTQTLKTRFKLVNKRTTYLENTTVKYKYVVRDM